jgi:hypothetical protein
MLITISMSYHMNHYSHVSGFTASHMSHSPRVHSHRIFSCFEENQTSVP